MKSTTSLVVHHLGNPATLERLYHTHESAFVEAMDELHKTHGHEPLVAAWHARLHYQETGAVAKRTDVWRVVFLALIAGTIARLPEFTTGIDPAFYYARIAPSFSVLAVLALYFVLKKKPGIKVIVPVTGAFLASLVYMLFLPMPMSLSYSMNTSNLNSSALHLPIFLWSFLGFAYIGKPKPNGLDRAEFVKYSGTTIIYSGVLLLGGVVLTLILGNLFDALGVSMTWIPTLVIYGVAAAPIVATYLGELSSFASKKFAPIIAQIFSPLFLLVLCVDIVLIGYHFDSLLDRKFLMIMDVLLVIVLGLVFFNASERDSVRVTVNDKIAYALIVVACVADAFALYGIGSRLYDFGSTPNRIAVIGFNILSLGNLIGMGIMYQRHLAKGNGLSAVKRFLGDYLPVYLVWSAFVVFAFPFIFHFQ